MDKERRNNLRRVINHCKKILEADIEKRLIYYGITADGTFIDIVELKHLKDKEVEDRKRIELAIEKEMVGGLSKKDAIKRYIKHTAFTFLNRIAALRAMEVRGLIKETIIQRDQFGGRSLREREIAEANPSYSTYEILKTSLIEAFKEVSEEIKVLFDVNSEYSIVFPSERACRDIIKLLTEDVTKNDWKDDEIVGWIYQYFNDETRREYRKARRKPTPDDIPIINQFYTPHWIVKALVDNTLGRLWLEMHPDSKLAEFCTYLVPLKNGGGKREIKRAREIKVLDPACGSGHFLVYAFDVLYRMYQEDEPNTPTSEIPALILENNLFGIDIDLCSVQLAALSLYLKAKTLNPSLKIRKMNLVCADVRVSDGEKRSEFLKRFRDDPDLQEIFTKLFEDLSYTFEIGSLLKVHQPFEQLFKERSKGPKQARLLALQGQTQLGKISITGQARFVIESPEGSETTTVMVIPKERTIEEMLNELHKFERKAIEAQDMGTLLFATETEKSVGLLALLSEKYDVVLMNPPYGDMPPKTKEYLRKYYPKTHFDYYAAFIEQAIDLAKDGGYIGAITGRTFMFLRSYQWLREVLLKIKAKPQIILDLGFGVLDVAMARWAAFTLSRGAEKREREVIFIRLTECSNEIERIDVLEKVINAVKNHESHPSFYKVTLEELAKIPGMPYSYWCSESIREIFVTCDPLGNLTHIVGGLYSGDDQRLVREYWEVPLDSLGSRWKPFANHGGTDKFYTNITQVLDFSIMSEISNVSKFILLTQSIGWSQIVSSLCMSFRVLPKGLIAGDNSPVIKIYAPNKEEGNRIAYALCSLGNSNLFTYLFLSIDPTLHHRRKGYVSKLPTKKDALFSQKLSSLGHEIFNLMQECDTGNEISTQFIKPWLLQVLYGFNPNEKPVTRHPLSQDFNWSDWQSAQLIRSIVGSIKISVKELAELCIKRQQTLNKRIEEIQKEIDEEVYRIYGVPEEDRALIERELELQKGVSLESEEEKASKESKEVSKEIISVKEHVERLISYYIKKVMESDEDGIVPLDEMFPDNLFNRVRELIAQDFGKDRLDRVELEISEILGKSLKSWIEEDYFNFHVSLYRRRPMSWQLTSSSLGRSKIPGVFSCFLYYHKLDRDTIPKVLAFYLTPVKEKLYREKDRIFKDLEAARAAGNRKRINELSKMYEEALAKIEEIENMERTLNLLHNPREDKTKLKPDAKWVDKAISEVRDNGWNPIVDYGVRVNIQPLKELKLLHPAAERVK